MKSKHEDWETNLDLDGDGELTPGYMPVPEPHTNVDEGEWQRGFPQPKRFNRFARVRERVRRLNGARGWIGLRINVRVET